MAPDLSQHIRYIIVTADPTYIRDFASVMRWPNWGAINHQSAFGSHSRLFHDDIPERN